MLRPQQAITHRRRNDAGQTLIELLEFVLAAFLAFWLAIRLGAYFHGAWRTFVVWTVLLVGTLVFGFSIMIGFGYAFDYIRRREGDKTPDERDKPNGDGKGGPGC